MNGLSAHTPAVAIPSPPMGFSAPAPSWLSGWHELRDLLEVGQVVAVFPPPLPEGVVLQFQERSSLLRVPGSLSLIATWKFSTSSRRARNRVVDLPGSAFRCFTAMITVPTLTPVLTDFPLPRPTWRHPRRRSILTLGCSWWCSPVSTPAAPMAASVPAAPYGGDPRRADPDPRLCRHHPDRQGNAALRRQSPAGRQSGRLLESVAPVPDRRLLHPAHRGDRPAAHPFLDPYRGLHDRGGAHPGIFRTAAGAAQMGLDDEAVHPLHHLLQRAAAALGPVASGHGHRRCRLACLDGGEIPHRRLGRGGGGDGAIAPALLPLPGAAGGLLRLRHPRHHRNPTG